ncbi:HTH-type transcriptional regulator Lrp [Haladaptatus sp. DYF46]|uniref:HTH-type transcriptional regulator Lrp n=1 Tax=Haladaptatus sp. DYF46 TaxID=2886041 RepID=UPI001E5E8479|nr:HTH-type transcriptional regulator Lrp [Haladaptatus sp. DYF46]
MAYENLDAELLNALQSDGRASLRDLASDLDVSVTTISNHLDELQNSGAIIDFSPIVDYDALGYDVTAVIQLKVEGAALPDVTDRLQREDQMVSVYEVTGNHDIIAIGRFEDTDQMNRKIKSLLEDKDINESNTSVVLNSVSEYEQFDIGMRN